MSDMSETEEIYTLAERWIIFTTIYILCLVATIAFLCCRIKIKKNNIIVFIICVIYSSLFAFLNVIAVFDLFMNNIKGFEKLMNMIEKYYEIFNLADKIFGYIIFNILIYYMESGWYWPPLKVLDIIIRFVCSFKKVQKMYIKKTLCKTLVIQSIRVLLAGTILSLLIIYRKHFGLNNFLDYINCLLDCYSIFEIYSAVGYFLVQFFKDPLYDRRAIRRYYRYSQIKIIEKTEKYWKNVNETYNLINKNAPFFQNGSSSYHKFLQKKLNKIKTMKYKLINEEIINSINKSYLNDYSKENINQNYINNKDIKLNEKNQKNQEDNPTEYPIIIKSVTINNLSQNNNQKMNSDYEIATSLRKYKKAIRRINKLKKLSKTIAQESKIGLIEAKEYKEKKKQKAIAKGKKIEEDEVTKDEEKEDSIEDKNIQNQQSQSNQKKKNSLLELLVINVVLLLCVYMHYFLY